MPALGQSDRVGDQPAREVEREEPFRRRDGEPLGRHPGRLERQGEPDARYVLHGECTPLARDQAEADQLRDLGLAGAAADRQHSDGQSIRVAHAGLAPIPAYPPTGSPLGLSGGI